MRNTYLKTLYELAKDDNNVIALISDNGAIVYDDFRRDHPDQYINCGISEANMVSVSAGLAACGKIPFAYTIIPFLTMRAFEQVRNDVCMQKMNVKLVGIGAGFIYSNLGPTHHGTEDISLMRSLPGMTVYSPCDDRETAFLTRKAYEVVGPVYLRLATGSSTDIYEQDHRFSSNGIERIREGDDVLMISTGAITTEAIKAHDELINSGIKAGVINVNTIKPFDTEAILAAISGIKTIITLEEHSINGGLGSAVSEVLAENGGCDISFKRMGLIDSFSVGYGTYDEMKKMNGLSWRSVVDTIRGMLHVPGPMLQAKRTL